MSNKTLSKDSIDFCRTRDQMHGGDTNVFLYDTTKVKIFLNIPQ